MNIIEISALTKRYTKHTALDGIDLNIKKGTIHGLLGPNGAGKSTLIKILNGILPFDQGTVTVSGKDILAMNLHEIGYLPEERGLYKDCTIEYQLKYFARLKGMSRDDAYARVKYWFNRFEINNWKKKYLHELSKGMQQKIQFICSVLHNPSILYLDEPFSGFDPLNFELLKEQIEFLKANGCTIILSTHNMQSVEELCDEISFINRARIIKTGTVSEFKNSYSQDDKYRVTFKGNREEVEKGIKEEYVIDKMEYRTDRWEAVIRLKSDMEKRENGNRLVSKICGLADILSFEKCTTSLSEIFIHIVETKSEGCEQ